MFRENGVSGSLKFSGNGVQYERAEYNVRLVGTKSS